jgi:hypothetical protein
LLFLGLTYLLMVGVVIRGRAIKSKAPKAVGVFATC